MTMIKIRLPQNIQLQATHESWTLNIIDIVDITFEACPTSAEELLMSPLLSILHLRPVQHMQCELLMCPLLSRPRKPVQIEKGLLAAFSLSMCRCTWVSASRQMQPSPPTDPLYARSQCSTLLPVPMPMPYPPPIP